MKTSVAQSDFKRIRIDFMTNSIANLLYFPPLVARQTEVEYVLDDLMASITPENTHEEVDWGTPVGDELI